MSVLIIDGLNNFVRNFVVNPKMNSHGEQMGGCIGFLQVLRRLVDDLKPQMVCVVWEGGGSTRRRAIYSEYKSTRKPVLLNRFYGDDIPETEENRQKQMIKLLEFLKALPVCQLYVANCEADDVIAHLCFNTFKGVEKTIASSDKDFFQCLSEKEKTKIYSFHRKTFVTKEDVFKEFQITPQNFALAKSLCGDKSDNIPGVKGMGFKTAAKRFPFLGLEEPVILQDMFDYCSSHAEEADVYKRILADADLVKRNWKLVSLDGQMMSAGQSMQVDHIVKTFSPKCDKIRFIKSLIAEGMGDFDAHSYFLSFSSVKGLEYKS